MTLLIELKNKLRKLYVGYGLYLLPVIRFLLAFTVFFLLNRLLGYLPLAGNIFVLLILSLLCALLPLGAVVLFGGMVIVANCFAAGIGIGLVVSFMLILLYVLFFRYVAKDALALILTPITCAIGLPGAVPLGIGMARGAVSAISVAAGTFLYYLLMETRDVKAAIDARSHAGHPMELLESVQTLINGTLKNSEMLVMVVAGAATVIIVSMIRKYAVGQMRYLGLLIGSLTFFVISFAGSYILDTGISLLLLAAGQAGSLLIALLLEFFLFGVDYKKTEYLQYQDENYVYYVKAVPKFTVTPKNTASADDVPSGNPNRDNKENTYNENKHKEDKRIEEQQKEDKHTEDKQKENQYKENNRTPAGT